MHENLINSRKCADFYQTKLIFEQKKVMCEEIKVFAQFALKIRNELCVILTYLSITLISLYEWSRQWAYLWAKHILILAHSLGMDSFFSLRKRMYQEGILAFKLRCHYHLQITKFSQKIFDYSCLHKFHNSKIEDCDLYSWFIEIRSNTIEMRFFSERLHWFQTFW